MSNEFSHMKGDGKRDELIHLPAQTCARGGAAAVKVGWGRVGEAFNDLKNMIHAATQQKLLLQEI